MLRAFAQLRARRACRLLILGEGRQREAPSALAQELGLHDDFVLPGFVDNPVRYMARASVFALSSLLEGLPVALIEALAAGAPVVSTDCPSGPRETLQDGKYGALVPMRDAAAMTQALADALDRLPTPALLREAVAPFEVDVSVGRYRSALGLA